MSPKPDVSSERKPQILEAAMSVFARLGVGKARMDDVADEVGLSKGTLYLYFKNKDAIIQSIMENLLLRELDQARAVHAGPGTATEKLMAFTNIVVTDFRRMKPFIGLYFEFMALMTRRAGTRELIKSFFQDFMGILIPLIQEGVDSGEFRPVDVEEAAIAIGALFEGTILLWVYDPDTVDLDHHFTSGIRLVIDGLLA